MAKIVCECTMRLGMIIDSIEANKDIKTFFEEQVRLGFYIEKTPNQPYYVGHGMYGDIKWFADKWYQCKKMWLFVGSQIS